jgi:hypothetical protein
MKLWLFLVALFAGASGCGGEQSATFEVRRSHADEVLFESGNVRVAAQRVDDAIEVTLERRKVDRTGNDDGAGRVVLVLRMAEEALSVGTTLSIQGVTTYEHTDWMPPRNDVWVGDADTGIRRALLYAVCFSCYSGGGEQSQRFDLQLHVDAVGDRLVGRIEGQVEGGAGLSIGPAVQVVAEFDVRID